MKHVVEKKRLEKKLCAHSDDVLLVVECQPLACGGICGVLADQGSHISQKLHLTVVEGISHLHAWHHNQCEKKIESKMKEHGVVPVCVAQSVSQLGRGVQGREGNGGGDEEKGGKVKEDGGETIQSFVRCQERVMEKKKGKGKRKRSKWCGKLGVEGSEN